MKQLFFLLTSFILAAAHELPITVIIPSYNNIKWYEKNLCSVLEQKYKNFTVIYIDDCSIDGTNEAVRQYLDTHDPFHKITYIRNEIRRGALANHWHAVHMCDPNVIVVNLDGDDWFAHPHVLNTVNEAYADGKTAATYGQYIEYPSMQKGHCRELPVYAKQDNLWRRVPLPLPISHLRTFKAGLFHNIKLEDLLVNGDFFPTAGDVAFFFPVLEQAGVHVKFIPDILYVYNNDTPINDYKVRLATQLKCFQIIRDKIPYAPLANPVDFEEPDIRVDVCFISDNPDHDHIIKLIQHFDAIHYVQSEKEIEQVTSAEYVLIVQKNDRCTKEIDARADANMLHKTKVTHCYYDYHVNNGINLFNEYNAWHFDTHKMQSGPVMIKRNAVQNIHPLPNSLCLSLSN